MNNNDTAAPFQPTPFVAAVEPMDGYRLFLTFANGERRVFDAEPLLECPAFKPLKKKPFFDAVKVDHGAAQWPGGIDCCHDTLYVESVPV